jgi:hypothetical protein
MAPHKFQLPLHSQVPSFKKQWLLVFVTYIDYDFFHCHNPQTLTLQKLFPSSGEVTLTSRKSNHHKWQMDIV